MLSQKLPKPKPCAYCRQEFQPARPLQKVCGPMCANGYAQERRRKRERAETRKRRQELKTNGELLKDAQRSFNAYIRLRDRGQPCISCGRKTGSKENAGHYKTAGGFPELRFEELNVHLQCEHCNSYLSGNIAAYRVNLIKKIGLEKVEWLEGPHEPKKYKREEIIEIKRKYARMARELEKCT